MRDHESFRWLGRIRVSNNDASESPFPQNVRMILSVWTRISVRVSLSVASQLDKCPATPSIFSCLESESSLMGEAMERILPLSDILLPPTNSTLTLSPITCSINGILANLNERCQRVSNGNDIVPRTFEDTHGTIVHGWNVHWRRRVETEKKEGREKKKENNSFG